MCFERNPSPVLNDFIIGYCDLTQHFPLNIEKKNTIKKTQLKTKIKEPSLTYQLKNIS